MTDLPADPEHDRARIITVMLAVALVCGTIGLGLINVSLGLLWIAFMAIGGIIAVMDR